jgi:hypothetical protein
MDLFYYVQSCFISPIFCLLLPQFGILVHVSHNCIMDIVFRSSFQDCGHNDTSDDVHTVPSPTNEQSYIGPIIYILILICSDIFGAIDILSNVQVLN